MNFILTLILLVIGGLGFYFGRRAYLNWRETQRLQAYKDWLAASQRSTIKIFPPKNNEKTPLAAEQMFAALHGIFRENVLFQEQVSFELAAHDKFIHFYVHLPNHLKDFVVGQIYAQYPSVEITEVEDYSTQIPADLPIVGSELILTKDDFYPIQTFPNFTVDPLSGITGVLGSTGDREQVWIQLVVKPVSESWQEEGIEFVAAKRLGVSVERGLFLRFIGFIAQALVGLFRATLQPGTSGGEDIGDGEDGGEGSATSPKLSAPEEAALKAVEEKITKLGFATKIRVIATAPDPYTARSKIEAVTGAFKQFNTTNMNGFRSAGILESQEAIEGYRTREFSSEGVILNTEELASLYHLPASTVETPTMAWAGSKKGEPPSNLPIEGTVDDNEVTYLGTTDFRNFRYKFGIKRLDRRLHTYVIGKTGTGKSTLMKGMVIDDIVKGRGIAVIDPHGQLVQDILSQIPTYRINDVIYFNPADRDFPIGFNVLQNVNPDLRNVIASGVVGIFKKLFAESWGPRLEYILRNTVLALLEYPDSTLLGINRLLTDKSFRKRVITKINDPVVKDYFENEYERYTDKFRTEAIAPIQNKVGQFLSASTIRNIVGQPRSSIDLRQVMDEGKIILIDLSVGKIGEDTSALLGALMITQIQTTAMQRADIPEADRRDFYLYVDEFQNFATESFGVILSEARKYHLNLMLINQYIAQMPEEVAKAVFGNVGTIISFRVGSSDASGLVKEFEPVFESIDLVNLDNYHIYVKMAIDGVTRPAFSAKTILVEEGDTGSAEKIVAVSRERYARPREFVEQKIKEWSEDTQLKQAQDWRRRQEGGGSNHPKQLDEKGEWFVDGRSVPNYKSGSDKNQSSKSKTRRPSARDRSRGEGQKTESKPRPSRRSENQRGRGGDSQKPRLDKKNEPRKQISAQPGSGLRSNQKPAQPSKPSNVSWLDNNEDEISL